MKFLTGVLYKKVTNFTLALALVISSVAAVGPFIFSEKANAAPGSQVVYDALASVNPLTNHASLGYQATSTDEFGDYIQLGGENRVLDDVTVTLSSWARWSDRATWDASTYDESNSATFSHPITLNIYASTLTGGVPNTLLATSTQTFEIPYRPDGFAFNGIAHNITFDLSSLNAILPSEVIVGVEYNTQTHGDAPLGIAGPYNSLNVAVPSSQPVAVGQDLDVNSVFWDTSHGPFYNDGGAAGTDIFREDDNWSPNATVALRISATSIAGPALLFPQNNEVIDTDSFTFDWENVSDATSYEFQNSKISDAVNPDGGLTNVHFQGTSPISQLASSGAGEVTRWWQVRAVFADSSKSEWSEVWKMSIDMTNPDVALASPSNNAVVKGASVTQSWTTSSTDVDYYMYKSWNDAAGTSLRWEENFSSTSKTATNVADSTYWWQVQAVDHAGNVSGWTPLWKLTVDSTAPDVAITNPLDGAFINVLTPTPIDVRGTVTDANPRHYFVRVERSTGPATWTTVYSQTTLNATSFTDQSIYSWTPTTDGTYRITLEARDAAGGTSSSGNKDTGSVTSITVVVDTANPTVAIDPQTSTTGNTPTITGTVDDVDATLEVIFNGDTYPVTNNAGIWSFTSPIALANGIYGFSITATDTAGNETTETADVIVAVVTPAQATPETPAGTTVTTVTPTTINPAAFASILGATTEDTTDQATNNGDTDVEGASNFAAVDTDATDGTFFGLAWYWWLVILAALSALIAWIVGAVRRRREES